MVLAGLTARARMDGWLLRFVYWQPPVSAAAQGEQWWLAHQRALREARGDDLDGNESAPYGLSVPANPRILQMRGQGKGIGGNNMQVKQRSARKLQAWSCRGRLGVQQGTLALSHSLPCLAPGFRERPPLLLLLLHCKSAGPLPLVLSSQPSCIFPSLFFCPSSSTFPTGSLLLFLSLEA